MSNEEEFYNPHSDNERTYNVILSMLRSIETRLEKNVEAVWNDVSVIKRDISDIDKVVNNGLSHKTDNILEITKLHSDKISNIEQRYATRDDLAKAVTTKEEAEKSRRSARRWRISFIWTVFIGSIGFILTFQDEINAFFSSIF